MRNQRKCVLTEEAHDTVLSKGKGARARAWNERGRKRWREMERERERVNATCSFLRSDMLVNLLSDPLLQRAEIKTRGTSKIHINNK